MPDEGLTPAELEAFVYRLAARAREVEAELAETTTTVVAETQLRASDAKEAALSAVLASAATRRWVLAGVVCVLVLGLVTAYLSVWWNTAYISHCLTYNLQGTRHVREGWVCHMFPGTPGIRVTQ